MIKTKKCLRCQRRKSISSFHRNRTRKDGLQAYCKECVRPAAKKKAEVIKQRRKVDQDLADQLRSGALKWYHQNKDQATAIKMDWERRNPAKVKAHRQRTNIRRYGISVEHYESLLRKQKELCAVCREPEVCLGKDGEVRPLSIDHDHETGKVRGLVCHHCNVAIGMIRDNPKVALAMARYLQKWSA